MLNKPAVVLPPWFSNLSLRTALILKISGKIRHGNRIRLQSRPLTARKLNFQSVFTALQLKETALPPDNWQRNTAPKLKK